jgi:hypothetical protein
VGSCPTNSSCEFLGFDVVESENKHGKLGRRVNAEFSLQEVLILPELPERLNSVAFAQVNLGKNTMSTFPQRLRPYRGNRRVYRRRMIPRFQ